MTTRTSRSAASSVVDDTVVYLYALRAAVLDYNIQRAGHAEHSPADPNAKTPPADANTTHASSLARPRLRQAKTGSIRPADGWTSALTSLGDVFKDSSAAASKASRFPKDFVKALDLRMERIARGADSTYSDPLFRQTVGAYYTTYAQPAFQKKLKENRQIEEVILMFVTTASGILKKRMEGDDWKSELNRQVGRFVGVIRDTLRTSSRQPGELLNRLDTYCAKLAEDVPPPAPPQSSLHVQTSSLSAIQTPYPSYSAGGGIAPSPVSPAPARESMDLAALAANLSLDDMPFVRAVGDIFGKTDADLRRDVASLKRTCTEEVRPIPPRSLSSLHSLIYTSMRPVGGVPRPQVHHQRRRATVGLELARSALVRLPRFGKRPLPIPAGRFRLGGRVPGVAETRERRAAGAPARDDDAESRLGQEQCGDARGAWTSQ